MRIAFEYVSPNSDRRLFDERNGHVSGKQTAGVERLDERRRASD